METCCHLVDIFASGACFDFWLNRYQTLFTGMAAIMVGIIAAWIAVSQTSIAKQQVIIMADQQAQAKALATLKLDEAFRALEAPYLMIYEGHLQNADLWGLNSGALLRFKLPYSIEELSGAASVAFPSRTTDLASFFRAAVALDEAYEEHNNDPWHPVGLMKAMSDIDQDTVTKHTLRGQEAAEVVRKFVEAYNKVSDLMPGARAA
jgi:hypothetical protein